MDTNTSLPCPPMDFKQQWIQKILKSKRGFINFQLLDGMKAYTSDLCTHNALKIFNIATDPIQTGVEG